LITTDRLLVTLHHLMDRWWAQRIQQTSLLMMVLTLPLFLKLYFVTIALEFGIKRCIVPFVACGDLRGFDSDTNYDLDVSL
jgi:hypothetical protein